MTDVTYLTHTPRPILKPATAASRLSRRFTYSTNVNVTWAGLSATPASALHTFVHYRLSLDLRFTSNPGNQTDHTHRLPFFLQQLFSSPLACIWPHWSGCANVNKGPALFSKPFLTCVIFAVKCLCRSSKRHSFSKVRRTSSTDTSQKYTQEITYHLRWLA